MLYLIITITVLVIIFIIWKFNKPCGCKKCNDSNCDCEENYCTKDKCICHDVQQVKEIDVIVVEKTADVVIDVPTELLKQVSHNGNGHVKKEDPKAVVKKKIVKKKSIKKPTTSKNNKKKKK